MPSSGSLSKDIAEAYDSAYSYEKDLKKTKYVDPVEDLKRVRNKYENQVVYKGGNPRLLGRVAQVRFKDSRDWMNRQYYQYYFTIRWMNGKVTEEYYNDIYLIGDLIESRRRKFKEYLDLVVEFEDLESKGFPLV